MNAEISIGAFVLNGKLHLIGANSPQPAAYRRTGVVTGMKRLSFCGVLAGDTLDTVSLADFAAERTKCRACEQSFAMLTSLFVNTPVVRLLDSVREALVSSLPEGDYTVRLHYPNPKFTLTKGAKTVEHPYNPAPFRAETVGSQYSPTALNGEARTIASNLAGQLVGK